MLRHERTEPSNVTRNGEVHGQPGLIQTGDHAIAVDGPAGASSFTPRDAGPGQALVSDETQPRAASMATLQGTAAFECLRLFVPAPVAEALLSGRTDRVLCPHRQEVVVLFLDLRGFTAFSETTEPEEVSRVLREYHALIGRALKIYGGTLERFTGDGTMIFFNDPIPVPDATERAIRLALALRDSFRRLEGLWQARGHFLGLGAGISKGYATAGLIGFDGHWDYAVIGPVTNLAARLCELAEPAQILVCQRIFAELGERIDGDFLASTQLKGFTRRTEIFSVRALRDPHAADGRS
jgi:class 3 adenylate cyclase